MRSSFRRPRLPSLDGDKVGEGRLERTHAIFFSMDETLEMNLSVSRPFSLTFVRF